MVLINSNNKDKQTNLKENIFSLSSNDLDDLREINLI